MPRGQTGPQLVEPAAGSGRDSGLSSAIAAFPQANILGKLPNCVPMVFPEIAVMGDNPKVPERDARLSALPTAHKSSDISLMQTAGDGVVSFGKKQAPTSRRRCERDEVMLAGSAMAITRSRSIVVGDLSAIGAGLNGRDLPGPGDDLLMIVGSQDRMARVAWRAGDRCGVRFDPPLIADQMEQMKAEADWSVVAGWER